MRPTAQRRQNAAVSILQFIVDIQWTLLFLVLLIVGIVWVRRMPTTTREAVRGALLARGIKASVGSLSLEVGAPANAETLATAAAPDEQIAQGLEPSETETEEEQVQQIRRSAIEQVMREAAEWGWNMAQAGAIVRPAPQIIWNGDQPEIDNGFSPIEKALIDVAAFRSKLAIK